MRNAFPALLAIAVLAAGCAENPANPIGSSDISGLTSDVAERLLGPEWNRFKWESTSYTFMGRTQKSHWYHQISLPFPNEWPPGDRRSYSYYAYSANQWLHLHGPMLTFSSPWARVVLTDGMAPRKELLADSVGPAVAGKGSQPISRNLADRLIQIRKDGEANIASMLRWTRLPDDSDASTRAIKDYYCQWEIDHSIVASQFIRARHERFFTWLSCPTLRLEHRGVIP